MRTHRNLALSPRLRIITVTTQPLPNSGPNSVLSYIRVQLADYGVGEFWGHHFHWLAYTAFYFFSM